MGISVLVPTLLRGGEYGDVQCSRHDTMRKNHNTQLTTNVPGVLENARTRLSSVRRLVLHNKQFYRIV